VSQTIRGIVAQHARTWPKSLTSQALVNGLHALATEVSAVYEADLTATRQAGCDTCRRLQAKLALNEAEHLDRMADAWYLGRRSADALPPTSATGPQIQAQCEHDLSLPAVTRQAREEAERDCRHNYDQFVQQRSRAEEAERERDEARQSLSLLWDRIEEHVRILDAACVPKANEHGHAWTVEHRVRLLAARAEAAEALRDRLQQRVTRAHAALDAADKLMALRLEEKFPSEDWQKWRRTHRQALCDDTVAALSEGKE